MPKWSGKLIYLLLKHQFGRAPADPAIALLKIPASALAAIHSHIDCPCVFRDQSEKRSWLCLHIGNKLIDGLTAVGCPRPPIAHLFLSKLAGNRPDIKFGKQVRLGYAFNPQHAQGQVPTPQCTTRVKLELFAPKSVGWTGKPTVAVVM